MAIDITLKNNSNEILYPKTTMSQVIDLSNNLYTKSQIDTTVGNISSCLNTIVGDAIVPSGTLSITSNNTYDVTSKATVVVDVPIPSGYIVPSGSSTYTENGTYNVSNLESVIVNVLGSSSGGVPVSIINRTATSATASDLAGVTNLGYLFDGYETIQTVQLPSSFVSAGQGFSGCSALTSLTFESTWSGTNLPELNLSSTALTSFTMPNSVISATISSLKNCSTLESFTVSNNIEEFAWGGDYTARSYYSVDTNDCYYLLDNNGNKAVLVGCGSSVPASLTIDPNTRVIADAAFSWRTGITSVTIPSSVKGIGGGAFRATGLTSVVIPSTVTKIDYGAFRQCSSLTDIYCEVSSRPEGWNDGYGQGIDGWNLSNASVHWGYTGE